MVKQFGISLIFSTLLLIGTCSFVFSQNTPYNIEQFTRISNPETINPLFNVAGGVTTANSYTGFVEIYVCGSGSNNFYVTNALIDAFYHYTVSTNTEIKPEPHALRFGSETQIQVTPMAFPFLPSNSCATEADSLHISELIVAVEGNYTYIESPTVLNLASGFIPVFSPNHCYRFIIDIGQYNGTITLGAGDCGTYDNPSIGYNITIWQAAISSPPVPVTTPQPVPTLSEWGLILLSFIMLSLGMMAIQKLRLRNKPSN